MGFAAAAKAVLLVQLSLLLVISFNVSAQVSPEPLPPHYHEILPVIAPSQPPSHHHHEHPYRQRHHHHHPPSPSPIKPPTNPPHKAPIPEPVYPPTKPPVHPPTKPPVHPPTKPPTYGPPKPPVHPPTKPPTKPPVHPPTKPPTHSPTYPPSHPPAKPPTYPKPPVRSLVAVQGVVYCESCKYAGVGTLLGAKPIPGAIVKLTCKNTKYNLVVEAKTDKNGYFFLEAPKTITSFGAHKCTVSLVSSPWASCSKPSNLNGGSTGATLRPEEPHTEYKLPFILYTVGPFAFEPKCY
ncbi:non-classical arabinogalactan protein 31-like [Durio zibethinus]|uniref:Non-classical arabinogalactan protein 31-like n=1 Tax=Durio zibethinus TaxID=66656 RepID=A0A6P5WYB4_DURZI|nr:non-classical arabinogalactan protein 31-like [Durio zibethinus]